MPDKSATIRQTDNAVNPLDVSYILHHMNEDALPDHAVSPPIFQTSNFCFSSFAELKAALEDEVGSCLYTRGNNPTVNLIESKIAALEHGEKAKLLGAGVAAISNAVMAFVRQGDHIICVADSYGWMQRLLIYLERFGVSHTIVDGTRIENIERAIRPETRIIYLESPTSLTFFIQDIPAITAIAKAHGIRTIMDNSWATPIFCNPIDFGVDLVVHSLSKYFGGNSDIIGGVIIGTAEDIDHIVWQESLQLGAVADPIMAWLVMRGMRTLHIRMPVHYKSALAVAQFLENHPRVAGVNYPLLASHPQHELAQRLFRGGSGLFSFRLKTQSVEDVAHFVDSLSLFKRAVSWGGYESLVFPEAAHYARSVPVDRLNLIRLHIGLEDVSLLIQDLDRALGRL